MGIDTNRHLVLIQIDAQYWYEETVLIQIDT
jgi:hypothetical protein